jgi:rhodanese-related sulfurtransferase
MLQSKSFPLINVHVPYEGEIEPTDALIPYDRIADNLDKLPKDKTTRFFLYCRSGNMRATAAKTLVKLGHTDVWDLDGGVIAWQAAGYPILDRKR